MNWSVLFVAVAYVLLLGLVLIGYYITTSKGGAARVGEALAAAAANVAVVAFFVGPGSGSLGYAIVLFLSGSLAYTRLYLTGTMAVEEDKEKKERKEKKKRKGRAARGLKGMASMEAEWAAQDAREKAERAKRTKGAATGKARSGKKISWYYTEDGRPWYTELRKKELSWKKEPYVQHVLSGFLFAVAVGLIHGYVGTVGVVAMFALVPISYVFVPKVQGCWQRRKQAKDRRKEAEATEEAAKAAEAAAAEAAAAAKAAAAAIVARVAHRRKARAKAKADAAAVKAAAAAEAATRAARAEAAAAAEAAAVRRAAKAAGEQRRREQLRRDAEAQAEATRLRNETERQESAEREQQAKQEQRRRDLEARQEASRRQHEEEKRLQQKQLDELEAFAAEDEGDWTAAEGKAGDGGGGEAKEDSECVVCMEQEKTHIFIPCGHKCVCKACADVVMKDVGAKCPLCRKKASQVYRVFD